MPRADLSGQLAKVLSDLHADKGSRRKPDAGRGRGSREGVSWPAQHGIGVPSLPPSVAPAAPTPAMCARDTLRPADQQDAQADALRSATWQGLQTTALSSPPLAPSSEPGCTPSARASLTRGDRWTQAGLGGGMLATSLAERTLHGSCDSSAMMAMPPEGCRVAQVGVAREPTSATLLLRGQQRIPSPPASKHAVECIPWALQPAPALPAARESLAGGALSREYDGSAVWPGQLPSDEGEGLAGMDAALTGLLPECLSPGSLEFGEGSGGASPLERGGERGGGGSGVLTLEDVTLLLDVQISAFSAPTGVGAVPGTATPPLQARERLHNEREAHSYASGCGEKVVPALQPGSSHSLPPLRLYQPRPTTSVDVRCPQSATSGPSTSTRSALPGTLLVPGSADRVPVLAGPSLAADTARLRHSRRDSWTALGMPKLHKSSGSVHLKQQGREPALQSSPKAEEGWPNAARGASGKPEHGRAHDGTVAPTRPPRPLRLRPEQLQLVPSALRRMSLDDMARCLEDWAIAISQKNWGQTRALERVIRSASSPAGNAVQRMGNLFFKSLKLRMALEGWAGTAQDQQRRVEAALPQRPLEAWQVAQYHELVPLMSLCTTVAFGAILDAAQDQSRVHVIFLGSQMTNPVGNRTSSLAQGLASLPQGPPKHVRFTLIDFSFWMSPSVAAAQAKLGRAALQDVQAQAAKLSIPRFEAEWLHVGPDNLVDLHSMLGEPWPSAPPLRRARADVPRQHGVYVCSMMQLSKIPVEPTEMSPRDVVLQWLCDLRPDVLAFVESDVDQGPTLESRMRGCLRHFSASMAMHDHILATLPSPGGTGGEGRGNESFRDEDTKEHLRKRKRDVGAAPAAQPGRASAALYASEETFCGRFVFFSLAPPMQPIVCSMGIAQWRQLFCTVGFQEVVPPPSTLHLVNQYMGGMPHGLQVKVVGGTVFFAWRGEPLFFTSLWTWPSDGSPKELLRPSGLHQTNATASCRVMQ